MPLKAAAGAALFLSVVLSSGCRVFHPATSSGSSPAVSSGQFLPRSLVVAGTRYHYTVYLPPGYDRHTKWPVILSLHGAGECGADGVRPSQAGLGAELRQAPDRFPCIVVFPQTTYQIRYWTSDFDQALATLDQGVREFNGDPQRLYLTGYSLGGAGSWFLAASHPGKFAAIAPICGRIAIQPNRARNPLIHRLVTERDPYAAVAERIGRTPVWVFHGQADPIVPVRESRRVVAALKSRGASVQYTEYPGVGHGAWVNAYDEPDLPRWLLSCRLTTPQGESYNGSDHLRRSPH